MNSERKSARGLLILACISLLAYGGMFWLHLRTGSLRGPQTPWFIACYGLAYATYLAAVIWAERRHQIPGSMVWAAAIAFRLALLLTVPTLSDDVYRYLWDGHVANHGVSPYAYAITAPELDALDTPIRALTNNPDMASPYLPVAQWLFQAVTWRFPLRPIYLQVTLVILDLVSALLVSGLLRIAGLPARRILLYLWHPLAIVEIAHAAHIDAWMVFLTLVAVYLALAGETGRSTNLTWLSPIALALATLTKILPVLLLPVLFWRWRWRERFLFTLTAAALVIPAGLATGWGLTGPLDGRGLFGALRIYNRYWAFNSGLFSWFEPTLSDVGLASADIWARWAMGLLMALVLLAVGRLARDARTPRSLLRLIALPFMAYLLLTTTVHPWYLLILLAFLPFWPPSESEPGSRWWYLAPWLYLSAAIALSYLTYLDPLAFRDRGWVRMVEWLPTWGMLVILIPLSTRWARRSNSFLAKTG